MVTPRGVAAGVIGVASAIVAARYGAEELMLVAIAAFVLLALGMLQVRWVAGRARAGVQVGIRVPSFDVPVGAPGSFEIHVENCGKRRVGGIYLQSPEGRWELTRPGLAPLSRGRPASGRSIEGVTGVPAGRRSTAGTPRSIRKGLGRGAEGAAVRLPALCAGSVVVARVNFPTDRRGVLVLSASDLWCEDVFGFSRVPVVRAPSARAVVVPCPDSAWAGRQVPGVRMETLQDPASAMSAMHAGAVRGTSEDQELTGLRPYVPGDRLNLLHWPALARDGQILVRDFGSTGGRSIRIILDLMGRDGDEVELALSAAAGAGLDAMRSGTAVDLEPGAGERFHFEPGEAGVRALLRALAVCGPDNAGGRSR